MSENARTAQVESSGRIFLYVWLILLGLTITEVVLAYQHLGVKVMLTLLLGLSVVKASLIIAYFMHLRYERASLAVTLMPALLFIIVLLLFVFPDSVRMIRMGPP